MTSVFDPAIRDDILRRIAALRPDAPRQWGKMDLPRALAHLSMTVEAAMGRRTVHRNLLVRVIGPLFRGVLLSPKPFGRNAPTSPDILTSTPGDFAAERARLAGLVREFCEAGPDAAARYPHGFIGRVTGDEWGRLQWKHLDHHLRQFGG